MHTPCGLAIAPDGMQIAMLSMGDRQTRLRIASTPHPEEAAQHRLPAGATALAWSPTAQVLAFTAPSLTIPMAVDVFLVDHQTGQTRNLMPTLGGHVDVPSRSPQGDRLTFGLHPTKRTIGKGNS